MEHYYGYAYQNLREAISALIRQGELCERLKSAAMFVGKLRPPAFGVPAPIAPHLTELQRDVDRFVNSHASFSDDELRALAEKTLAMYEEVHLHYEATRHDSDDDE